MPKNAESVLRSLAMSALAMLCWSSLSWGQGFSTSLVYPTGHPYTPSNADPTIDIVVSNASGTSGKTYGAWRRKDRLCYGTKTLTGSWVIDSTLTGTNIWNLALAVQASGEVPHIVYMDLASTPTFTYRSQSGGSWFSEAIVSPVSGDSYYVRSASIALDNSSVPRVALSYSQLHGSVWTEYLLFGTRNGTNSWALDTVSTNTAGTLYGPLRLRMQGTTPHIAINELTSDFSYSFHYATKGSTWTVETVPNALFGDMAFLNVPIAAYMDGNRNLAYAYRDATLGWIPTNLGPVTGVWMSITTVSSTVLIAMLSVNGDSIRIASKPPADGWNFQLVSAWPAYTSPYTHVADHQSFVVGGYASSGTVKAHIAYFNPVTEYRMAKGTLETSDNNMVAGDADDGSMASPLKGTAGIVLSRITTGSGGEPIRLAFTYESAENAELTATVLDIMGRRVASEPISGSSRGLQTAVLSLPGIQNGLYFLRVSSATGLYASAKVAIVR